MDGTGYPDRLRGKKIPLGARVLEIADVFDALTTERPYKAAFSAPADVNIMEDEVRRGWWDQDIFKEFLRIFGGQSERDSTKSLANAEPVPVALQRKAG